MTQYEFQSRVQMNVSTEEYSHIEAVYMSSDLDKDEFCKLWVKMNHKRVSDAKAEQKRLEEEQAKREKGFEILFANDGITFEQGCTLADNFFNKTQKKFFQSIGIEMEDKSSCVPMFKQTSTVLYELKVYLKVA